MYRTDHALDMAPNNWLVGPADVQQQSRPAAPDQAPMAQVGNDGARPGNLSKMDL
jgi:hypothetical protein